jgi:methionine synthase I (cobalamin-dependent)
VLENRIAIIDGAMGTTIRTYGMTEADIAASASRTPARICSTTATSSRSRSRR